MQLIEFKGSFGQQTHTYNKEIYVNEKEPLYDNEVLKLLYIRGISVLEF